MQTTTGHPSLAIHLPTAVNAHHHESEYINFITIFIKIIATGLYGVYVLKVLYCLLIVFLSMHSYGEEEEKRKGNWVGTNMGTVLILYFSS